MLKSHKRAKLTKFKQENISYIKFYLIIKDETEGTIYSNVFNYVFIMKEKHSIEELSEVLFVSISTLKNYIKRINLIIERIECYIENNFFVKK